MSQTAQIRARRDNRLARRLGEFKKRLDQRTAQGIPEGEARQGLLEEVREDERTKPPNTRRTKIKLGKW